MFFAELFDPLPQSICVGIRDDDHASETITAAVELRAFLSADDLGEDGQRIVS